MYVLFWLIDAFGVDLKYMTTERGTKLLIEGWWGMSRHPNYM